MVSEYRRAQAYKAGKKAHADGKPHTANNRERGTIYYDDWADGWIEANGGVVPTQNSSALTGDWDRGIGND